MRAPAVRSSSTAEGLFVVLLEQPRWPVCIQCLQRRVGRPLEDLTAAAHALQRVLADLEVAVARCAVCRICRLTVSRAPASAEPQVGIATTRRNRPDRRTRSVGAVLLLVAFGCFAATVVVASARGMRVEPDGYAAPRAVVAPPARALSAAAMPVIGTNADGAHVEAREVFERAVQQLGAGNRDEAVADLKRVIELDPGLTLAYAALAEALRATEEPDAVAAYWTSVVDRQPQNATAFEARAHVRETQQDVDAALADHDEACRLGRVTACAAAEKLRADR